MKIELVAGNVINSTDDTVVISGFEGKKPLDMNKLIPNDVIKNGDFSGKPGEILLVYTKNAKPKRVILAGLGKKKKLTTNVLRNTIAQVIVYAKKLGIKEMVFPADVDNVTSITESIIMGDYNFIKKSKSQKIKLSRTKIIVKKITPDIKKAFETGKIFGETSIATRDLINTSASVATPEYVANIAKSTAKKYGFSCQVFNKKQIQKMKMSGLLAVNAGSVKEPRFVVMEHNKDKKLPTIALVGKGITFDSGGLDIKPAAYMETMKSDKGGASAVIYTLAACAALKIKLHVVGIIALTENMPGNNAYKPGDIITTMSGKTIEVLNTDAEGRIILGDALHYATKSKPEAIIDIATLTGACWVALGEHAAGLMGTGKKLIDGLKKAGEKTDERVWELPFYDEYKEMIISEHADIKNVVANAPSGGGAITAGAFLSHFVGDIKWAHIDIGGTDWARARKGILSKGSVGFGTRLLTQFLLDYQK